MRLKESDGLLSKNKNNANYMGRSKIINDANWVERRKYKFNNCRKPVDNYQQDPFCEQFVGIFQRKQFVGIFHDIIILYAYNNFFVVFDGGFITSYKR